MKKIVTLSVLAILGLSLASCCCLKKNEAPAEETTTEAPAAEAPATEAAPEATTQQ